MRVPHYSGHPSIVRVWSLSRPSIVRVLASPPSECGQTHTNSRHTHLPLPHNSSSIPLQSTRTGETYTMPYAAGELCLQHNHTFIRLVVGYNLYFILVISRIVRLPALLRILRTLNSAPSRTIQARNHIVRVPAIVRVLWFGTYPHYRGHPTVTVKKTK